MWFVGSNNQSLMLNSYQAHDSSAGYSAVHLHNDVPIRPMLLVALSPNGCAVNRTVLLSRTLRPTGTIASESADIIAQPLARSSRENQVAMAACAAPGPIAAVSKLPHALYTNMPQLCMFTTQPRCISRMVATV